MITLSLRSSAFSRSACSRRIRSTPRVAYALSNPRERRRPPRSEQSSRRSPLLRMSVCRPAVVAVVTLDVWSCSLTPNATTATRAQPCGLSARARTGANLRRVLTSWGHCLEPSTAHRNDQKRDGLALDGDSRPAVPRMTVAIRLLAGGVTVRRASWCGRERGVADPDFAWEAAKADADRLAEASTRCSPLVGRHAAPLATRHLDLEKGDSGPIRSPVVRQ
jgi:hypothetical protein